MSLGERILRLPLVHLLADLRQELLPKASHVGVHLHLSRLPTENDQMTPTQGPG